MILLCFHVLNIFLHVNERPSRNDKLLSGKKNKKKPRTQFEVILGLNFNLLTILLCLVWDFTNSFHSARVIIGRAKPGKTDHLHGANVAEAEWSRVKSLDATITG